MTDRPRSILVAVDFGEASGRAVSIGGALAARCGASLRLLHAGAFEMPPYMGSDRQPHSDTHGTGSHQHADEFLAEFGRRYTPSAFTTAVDGSAPVDTILRVGGTSDLLVMGTHGRRGVSRWWLGSVAERVLREISTPLLIVRAGPKTEAEDVFQRVLVYASAPLKGTAAMEYAGMLAECFAADVLDARYDPLEPALDRSGATMLAVSMPAVRSGAWLSNIGEPIVRFCERPILFVPESADR